MDSSTAERVFDVVDRFPKDDEEAAISILIRSIKGMLSSSPAGLLVALVVVSVPTDSWDFPLPFSPPQKRLIDLTFVSCVSPISNESTMYERLQLNEGSNEFDLV